MTKTDIARKVTQEFIDAALNNNTSYSKNKIAAYIYDLHPDKFKDKEDARKYVRLVTGSMGRKIASRDEQLAADFALLEQPVQELDLKPFIVPKKYKKALVMSDIHSRFHDRNALETAINYGLKRDCDLVIINGDLLDFYQFSKFDKNPDILRYFYSEREWVTDFLELLQKHFGKVIFKKGNHDIRRELHIQRKLNDVPEIDRLTDIRDYVFFDGSTVEVVDDYNIIEFGKLNVMHGHEYYGSGVHVAYNRLNKAMDNVISGHSHVTQNSIKKSISGKFYGSWTTGCLCSLSPRYNPQNNWNHGFAIVEKEPDGEFIVDNKQIIGNKIF
jgi:predicted phosphodiesterase